jgi:hypothetical protein
MRQQIQIRNKPQIHRLKMKIYKAKEIITDYDLKFLKIALAIFKSVIISFFLNFLICESVALLFFISKAKFLNRKSECVALQGL